jgi:nucleotide-binding universal stress UspA family protein
MYPDWRVEVVVAEGSPVRTVLDQARKDGAEMILLGSHGPSVLQRFFLGRVAQRVAEEAGCSVHVARPRVRHDSGSLRIILLVDDSSASQAVIDSVVQRDWSSRHQFEIVSVIDPGLEEICLPTFNADDWIDQHDAPASERICRFVRGAVIQFKNAGLPVISHTFEGNTKRLALKHAEGCEADCIFLAARSFGGNAPDCLNSMAAHITARAHCSVEIVR